MKGVFWFLSENLTMAGWCPVELTGWRWVFLSRVGSFYLFPTPLPASYWEKNTSYRRGVWPTLFALSVFPSDLDSVVGYRMRADIVAPAPFTLLGPKLVASAAAFAAHPPQSHAADRLLTCKREPEPAGLRQRRLGRWSQNSWLLRPRPAVTSCAQVSPEKTSPPERQMRDMNR